VEGEADPAASSFGRILIGMEGLARLWGDEAALVRRALDLVKPWLPGQPRAGIGNTRFGAAVAARIGAGAIPIGGRREEAAFLAPLPLGLLPAAAQTQERMRVLGLRLMGELAALDRSAVIARFGADGAGLHDLVRGMDRRPLRPRRPVERLRRGGAGAGGRAGALRCVPATSGACERLSARGAGAAGATSLWLDPPRQVPAGRGAASRHCRAGRSGGLLERTLGRLEAEPLRPPRGASAWADGAVPEAGQQLASSSALAQAAPGRKPASLAIRSARRVRAPRDDLSASPTFSGAATSA
jgi:hypothetical protein